VVRQHSSQLTCELSLLLSADALPLLTPVLNSVAPFSITSAHPLQRKWKNNDMEADTDRLHFASK